MSYSRTGYDKEIHIMFKHYISCQVVMSSLISKSILMFLRYLLRYFKISWKEQNIIHSIWNALSCCNRFKKKKIGMNRHMFLLGKSLNSLHNLISARQSLNWTCYSIGFDFMMMGICFKSISGLCVWVLYKLAKVRPTPHPNPKSGLDVVVCLW